jgi:phosphopantetheinyl transferase (holo-ACP synthase)
MGTIVSRRLLGVGVDVVSVSRLARVRSRRDVLEHVRAPEEASLVTDDLGAARLWAGKEAVAKTLSTGFWQQGVDWLDIRFDEKGSVSLLGRAARIAGPSQFALDYTRMDDMVVAVAFRWGPSETDSDLPEAPE